MISFLRPPQLLHRFITRCWSSTSKDGLRKNEKITSKSILFIDQNGVKMESKSVSALLKTIDRKLYDLVEVNPSHSPPICKLVSKSDAFKRQLAAEEAAFRQRLKFREKEIRFGTSMADHDFDIRMTRVKESLEKAFRVKVAIEAKGVVNRTPIAKEQLWRRVLERLGKDYGKNLTIISSPQVEFRNLIATVALSNAKPPSTKASVPGGEEESSGGEE